MASGSVLTGPAMSLTVALICSTLLKPFLQESRRTCHSVKPGQGGKVTTLPPSASAGGRGWLGIWEQCSGFVVSLIPDPLMSLWFPCQSVLMELTVVMLLHILISCSRTVTEPSSVCLASADQETTAVLNIDNVFPVSKKYVQDELLRNAETQQIYSHLQYTLALYNLTSINWCRELLEVNLIWLVCSVKKPCKPREIWLWCLAASTSVPFHLFDYTHLCAFFTEHSSPTANQCM